MHDAKSLIDKATRTLFYGCATASNLSMNMCKYYLITCGEKTADIAQLCKTRYLRRKSAEKFKFEMQQTIALLSSGKWTAAQLSINNKNEETVAFLVGSCRLVQFPNMPGNVYHVCGENRGNYANQRFASKLHVSLRAASSRCILSASDVHAGGDRRSTPKNF